MPKKRELNVFNDEASDSSSNSEETYSSTGDSTGSLAEFIVPKGSVTEESNSQRDLDSILDDVSTVASVCERPKKKAKNSDPIDKKPKKHEEDPKAQ